MLRQRDMRAVGRYTEGRIRRVQSSNAISSASDSHRRTHMVSFDSPKVISSIMYIYVMRVPYTVSKIISAEVQNSTFYILCYSFLVEFMITGYDHGRLPHALQVAKTGVLATCSAWGSRPICHAPITTFCFCCTV